MSKVVWLSDLHFVCAGERVLGHDPTIRVKAAIEDINAHHSDAALCVISGDLVEHGSVAEYRELKTHLDRLTIPYLPLVGNHDDRAQLKTELSPKALPSDSTFIQYAVPLGPGWVVALDTLKVGHDAGAYCAARYAWLEDKLNAIDGAPVWIFMHHPPAPLGLPMQDPDGLEDGEAFLAFLKNYPNVRYLFIGHVHRPICGTLHGIPFATMRSCLYQAPPPEPPWAWDTFSPAPEAPNYGVIHIDGKDVSLHYHQFTPYHVGT